ncbi:hypothetical protein BJ170DRAFT_43508 [Xylariales sp. AK1849]|nr:hypothetical protein BJ170DRAFT_43508 [Xylariales sp. AK1849]
MPVEARNHTSVAAAAIVMLAGQAVATPMTTSIASGVDSASTPDYPGNAVALFQSTKARLDARRVLTKKGSEAWHEVMHKKISDASYIDPLEERLRENNITSHAAITQASEEIVVCVQDTNGLVAAINRIGDEGEKPDHEITGIEINRQTNIDRAWGYFNKCIEAVAGAAPVDAQKLTPPGESRNDGMCVFL